MSRIVRKAFLRSIFRETGGLDGYLPVFSFSKEEKEFRGVRQMVLFRSGAPYAVLEDAAMQMFLLLNGKARQLTVNTQIEGRVVNDPGHSSCSLRIQLPLQAAHRILKCV